MQVNFTARIPRSAWGSFFQALQKAALTHRVTWCRESDHHHINWVPGAKINALVDQYKAKDQ